MTSRDNYARITAYFPEGEVIYTNPFARYDASASPSPYNDSPQQINILLSILFNLVIVLLCIGDGYVIYRLIKPKK
jgi:hypothetical protein